MSRKIPEIDYLQIRLELLEELMDEDCEQFEVIEKDGAKRIFAAVTAIKLESKRREMIPRHNELIARIQKREASHA